MNTAARLFPWILILSCFTMLESQRQLTQRAIETAKDAMGAAERWKLAWEVERAARTEEHREFAQALYGVQAVAACGAVREARETRSKAVLVHGAMRY